MIERRFGIEIMYPENHGISERETGSDIPTFELSSGYSKAVLIDKLEFFVAI